MPPAARQRDRHPRLGHRVHRRGDDQELPARSCAAAVAVETSFGSTPTRRYEQHVVEGDASFANFSNGRARPRPRISRRPSETLTTRRVERGRSRSAGRAQAAHLDTALETVPTGIEPPAPSSSVDAAPAPTAARSASSCDRPADRAARNAASSTHRRPDRGDGLDRRRDRPEAADLAAFARARCSRLGVMIVLRAELCDPVEPELESSSWNSWPTSDSPHAGSATRGSGSASAPYRGALRRSRAPRDLTAGQLVDRVRVEVVGRAARQQPAKTTSSAPWAR